MKGKPQPRHTYSCALMLIEKLFGPSTFDPETAGVIQNKDELHNMLMS
jgi:hypothetical protein